MLGFERDLYRNSDRQLPRCERRVHAAVRLDLSEGVRIKNNHIALAGGVVEALERTHRNLKWFALIHGAALGCRDLRGGGAAAAFSRP